MEPLRLEPVPARVVAWHNRHPLARRVTPAHVSSLGYVALPFVQTPGKRGLKRGWDEEFLDGASSAAIARWGTRHGTAAPEAPNDGPLRVVAVAGSRFSPQDTLLTLYVRTAFIDDGWAQSRVLVGGGDKPAVFGHRLWSRPRQGMAGALSAATGALAVWMAWPHAPQPPAGEAVASAEAPAAEASAAAPEPAPPPDVAHEAAPGSAPAAPTEAPPPAPHGAAHEARHEAPNGAPAASAAPAPVAVATTARPVDVDPQWGTIDLPRLKPHLGGAEPELRPPRPPKAEPEPEPETAPPVAAARPGAARPPAPAPAPVAAAPRPERPPVAPAPGPVWALSTPPFRSEAEGERTSVTIAALFQRAGLRSVRVETIEIDGRWHVVGLPFPSRDAAENAQHLLASRGVRTEPVEF